MSDVEIRRAVDADEATILALARRTLGWGEDPRYTDLYRWKHDQSPFGRSPRWVALIDGQIVGFRVFLQWRFRRPDGSTVNAVRAVDTATDPDFQGRGIFTKLTLGSLEELAADGVGFVFNTPNDKSRPGYLKMGWEELGRPGVAVVPTVSGLARSLKSRAPAELWSEPTLIGEPVGDLVDRGAIPARRSDRIATDLTSDVMRWRYGLESLHYRAMTLGRDPAEGLAVFRMRRRARALEIAVGELDVPNAQARRALLRKIVAGSGADHLVYACPARVDLTPSVRASPLAPIVTWRAVNERTAPRLQELDLTVGDLELF